MLKTCYQPKFNHEISMWTLKIIRETNGKRWEQLAHFESFESAMEYRLLLIRSQYKGGLLAHENQFKVR